MGKVPSADAGRMMSRSSSGLSWRGYNGLEGDGSPAPELAPAMSVSEVKVFDCPAAVSPPTRCWGKYGTVGGHEKLNWPGASSAGQGGNGLSFFFAAMSFCTSGSAQQALQNGPRPRTSMSGARQPAKCHRVIRKALATAATRVSAAPNLESSKDVAEGNRQ